MRSTGEPRSNCPIERTIMDAGHDISSYEFWTGGAVMANLRQRVLFRKNDEHEHKYATSKHN